MRFQPKPKIELLEARMLEVLDREGKAIIALNASLFATDVSEQIKQLKQQVRGKEVTRLIYYFMLGKALVVGANPVPVFDILAGMASDALMVQRIGAIYGTDFSLKNAQSMVLEILRAWGLMAAAEYGLHLAADLLAHRHLRHQHGADRRAAGAGGGLEHVCGRQCREHLFPRCRLGRTLAEGHRAGHPRRRRKAEDQHPRADQGPAEGEVRPLKCDTVGWVELQRNRIVGSRRKLSLVGFASLNPPYEGLRRT